MISDEARELIETRPVAISTCTLDRPNISVAAYLKIVNDQIIITDNYMAKTISNINKNRKIELAVWGDDLVGYKIVGTAAYEDSGLWLDFVRNLKENDGLPAKGAIVITINDIKKIGD
jgi:predicted pyridoxine 5'-phosphate oxidase superfamily flavin-nucleotide-binding protein